MRNGKQERKSAHEQESQEEMKQTLLFHISSSPRPQLEDGGGGGLEVGPLDRLSPSIRMLKMPRHLVGKM